MKRLLKLLKITGLFFENLKIRFVKRLVMQTRPNGPRKPSIAIGGAFVKNNTSGVRYFNAATESKTSAFVKNNTSGVRYDLRSYKISNPTFLNFCFVR
jgi:hypothetical protein